MKKKLKEITAYKNEVIQRIVSSQDILKAIYYKNPNFLDMSDVDYEKVLYSNIYPYNFVPTTEEEKENLKTYVTISVGNIGKISGDYFRVGYLNVHIFTHKTLWRTKYQELRADYLVSEIDHVLSGHRGIGLGKLEFQAVQEFFVNTEYTGYKIVYKPVD
jgi:hypothetical protein